VFIPLRRRYITDWGEHAKEHKGQITSEYMGRYTFFTCILTDKEDTQCIHSLTTIIGQKWASELL
jgi:hypothetical protein